MNDFMPNPNAYDLVKKSVRMAFSWEQLAPPADDFEKTHHKEEPTEREWEAFRHWARQYESLQARGFRNGWLISGYEPDEIEPPHARWVRNCD